MRGVILFLALLALFVSLFVLERDRARLSLQDVAFATTPATLWTGPATLPEAPVVVIAHGFAGSQQMMQAISRDLAHAGFPVLAFDFEGHGRHPGPMSPDITRIEGTTALLTDQTLAVIDAAQALTGRDRVALIGHSMATDIIVRAGAGRDDIVATVAISMYSDAVTADHPARLLILSGEWEARLRTVALAALRQIAPGAGEGETVTQDGASRRAVAAPSVEHVGVLFSPVTLDETRTWIAGAAGLTPQATPPADWMWRLGILGALVVSVICGAGLLPRGSHGAGVAMRARDRAALAVLPAPVAVAGAALSTGAPGGFAGFAALSVFLGLWGLVQLGLLWRLGARADRPVLSGAAFLLAGALIFAVALDRYGAAFLVTGPRWGVWAVMLIGALPFALAEAVLYRRAPLGWRIAGRLVVLVALAGVMIAFPTRLGLLFTVLPVLVLYWLVFGIMGRQVAQRQGPVTAGLPLAMILAWSVAASTPLFAAG